MRKLSLFAVAAVGLTATALLADDTKSGGKLTDKEFVAKAVSGGLFEVQSSELALRHQNVSSDVRKFAQQMVTDHTKANQELTALLTRKGMAVPAAMDEKHREMIATLSNARGDFDKTYMDMQLKAHEKTVELFETASKELHDPDLKAWAAKTLPTLREHLEMVRKMAGSHR